ncbi:hypothetical protein ACFSSF_03680 [Dietzia aerolata]|uniref:hypothetical protein n=1 Tax=Dietzia aerolata TaxID=595984 RepID=UPI0036340E85
MAITALPGGGRGTGADLGAQGFVHLTSEDDRADEDQYGEQHGHPGGDLPVGE